MKAADLFDKGVVLYFCQKMSVSSHSFLVEGEGRCCSALTPLFFFHIGRTSGAYKRESRFKFACMLLLLVFLNLHHHKTLSKLFKGIKTKALNAFDLNAVLDTILTQCLCSVLAIVLIHLSQYCKLWLKFCKIRKLVKCQFADHLAKLFCLCFIVKLKGQCKIAFL